MMNLEEKMNLVDKLLNFNEKVILLGIQGKNISKEDINRVREICKEMEEIHKFNLNASDIELIKEISEFLKNM